MDMNDVEINYIRSSEIKSKVDEVSDIIKKLNLNTHDNDLLVNALLDLMIMTEKEMFAQGMSYIINTNKLKGGLICQ